MTEVQTLALEYLPVLLFLAVGALILIGLVVANGALAPLDTDTARNAAYEFGFDAFDEVERLEPEKISDVLRLVRATAELPCITCILSYGQAHVIQAIEKVLNVYGQKFLAKFIQLSITDPQIAQRKLNTLFGKNICQIIKTVIGYSNLLDNDRITLLGKDKRRNDVVIQIIEKIMSNLRLESRQ